MQFDTEWLITNGIGGYASGTVHGGFARHYHGLLIAALKPPLERTLLLAGLEETLMINRTPHRLRDVVSFSTEGTTPIWRYKVANALLEKRIWMEQGANVTYVQYRLIEGDSPVTLHADVLVNNRDHHHSTIQPHDDWQVEAVPNGLKIRIQQQVFYLYGAAFHPRGEWSQPYYKAVEAYRGQDDLHDYHLIVADFGITLNPGDVLNLIASVEPLPDFDVDAAYQRRVDYERGLIVDPQARPEIQRLMLAADQFIVSRPTPQDADGKTVLAGYHWFSDWGRDTMIALPGLTLATRRYTVAASIIRTFARFVDQGMIPNRFPDAGEQPEYNTVDATLWFFQAIRAYYLATQDKSLLQELFPILQDVIDWHIKGTRYSIHVDPADGLLYAGEDGVQLTWMDVKVNGWVVTPRTGKAVEINALWYNALMAMTEFAEVLQQDASGYLSLAERVKVNFARFWLGEYCYDVLDIPADGHDAALRPNQIIAVSLPYSLLTPEQEKAVVDVCEQYLLTPYGLRSLDPRHPDYEPHYGGNLLSRDRAYHQGTVWSWLIGAFISAQYKVYQDRERALAYLEPMFQQLQRHGYGTISEIFDGDAPHEPRGCIAQAWSVAECLRVAYEFR